MNKKAFGVFLVLFLMCLLIVPINAYSDNAVAKTKIAAGSVHSLALKSDGTVVAWGRNNYGQCDVPSGLSGVVSVAAGSSYSLALKSDGTVVAWGRNNYNQCTVPTDLGGVVAIAGGSSHSLALKSDGTVVAWGSNTNGQCNVPTDLGGVVAIAGGSSHSLALKSDGTVVAWGQNTYNQCTVPTDLGGVVAIAGGSSHSLALKSDGTVVAWGFRASYNKGQATVPPGLSGVIAIAAGSDHSLALKSDGTVVTWGDNSEGQCNVPSGLSSVVAIAGGGSHSLALKSDGTVVAWGANTYGQRTIPSGLNLAGLSGLVLNQGALSPYFSPDVFSYTASVDNSVSSIDVTPTVAGSVYIQINGTDQDSGAPCTIPLSVGENTVTISTSTADGLNSVYTVTVTRAGAPLSSDATLSGLALSNGMLSPAFDPATSSYTASVDNSVSSITVTPTASESHASITVDGTAVASGTASQAISLNESDNTITVLVTAQDGTQQVYTLAVTRESGGAIASYAFDGIPFSVASSGTFNGALYVDGGHGLPSGYGQDYTQKFMLPAGAITWARLYVGVWGGTYLQSGVLNVNFNGNALGTAGVGQGQATGIADMVEGSGCGVWWVAIDVTGNVVANSENTVVLRATDPNNTGFDTRIYGTILVAAVAQPDGPRMSYQVAEGNICLHYDGAHDGDNSHPANDQYTMSMDFPAGSIAPDQVAKAGLETVYLTGHKNANDYLYLNGNLVSDNANDGSGASLDTNNSPYNTWSDKYFGVHNWDVTGLTAQNNSVVYQRGNETYEGPVLAILTTQGAQTSSDVTLSNLTISSSALAPDFASGTINYTASVDSGVDSITVTPTASESSSTIKVNGTAIASGQSSDPISLSMGNNTVSIAVYAQDGTASQTYTVTVTRGGTPSQSGDATLSSLAISSGSLSPSFAAGTTSYTASVESSVDSITVTPTASESHATITVNGTAVVSGSASGAISLSVGDNSVAVVVYAQDGTTHQTYSVIVTRAGTGGAGPSVLGISPVSGTSDGGASVVITGSSFTGATAVHFGAAAASFTVDSDTQITATSPDVNGNGLTSNSKVEVTVTTAGGTSATSSSDQFTYIPAGYFGMNKAASPLATSLHGRDTGGLTFTRGDSVYYSQLAVSDQYTVHYTVTGIPDGATIIAARLYHYYCWSYTGLPAQGSMTLNDQAATLLDSYSDTKGMNPYNYPFGTISYDATGLVTGNATYTAVFTNTGSNTICPFGTGLVIVYHDPDGQPFECWLNEGADIIWPGGGVTADQATTASSFPGTVDTSQVAGAELITVVTSGNKGLNSLTFNNQTWGPNPSATVAPYGGPYADASQLAVDDRDVTDYIQSSNSLSIQSGGSGTMGPGSGSSSFSQADTMVPSNAFLVVTYQSAAVFSDATLSSLAISSGSLNPGFDSGTTSYTDSVDSSVSSVTLTPTASESHASITVNGIAVVSGAASGAISLDVGDNSISILVTAQDGSTQTYSVTVHRAAPPTGAPTISPDGGAYDAPQSIIVSISADLTVNQAVYYTTDGSGPSVADSVYYAGPFNLYLSQGTTTVQAAVYDSGSGIWGGVGSVVFVVSINPPVQNSGISPDTATFDKNTGGTDYADVPVALTLNGNTFVDVKNNGAALVLGTDYTVSGSTATILKSYLASLSVGETGLTFDFSAGSPATLTVNVKDTTPAPPVTVHVTGVSLNKSADTIAVSAIDQLTATVAPDSATDKAVTWTSSNTAVATVDQAGKVTAVSAGVATITVTTADGAKTATCAVTVMKTVNLTPDSNSLTITNEPVMVNVPSGVTNPQLIVAPAVSGDNKVFTMPQVDVNASTTIGAVKVAIPSGTQITAPASWEGQIQLPTIVSNPSNLPSNATSAIAIAVGSDTTSLTFSKPVCITLPGQSGKNVGFIRNGVFAQITTTLSQDQAADADSAAAALQQKSAQEGYYDNGTDITIWTLHFTMFVAYKTSGGTSGGGGGGGNTAPSVLTSDATAVTDASATLSGSITASGGTDVTAYGFLWGAGQNNLDQKQQVGTDNRSGSFQASLSGLKPETTYYFRAYATNSRGTAQGGLKQFTTASEVSPPPVPALVFSDVPASYWASEAINDLNSRGYVSGYPDGSFQPDSQITRAELVSIMNKTLKLSAAPAGAGDRPATPDFSDVSSGDWFYGPVENAVHAGIVKGYGDTFSPNDPITREQLACILVNALGKQDEAQASMSGKTGFSDDAGISAWARGSVAAAFKDGLIKGYQEDSSFRPQHGATRAEACAMIGNLLNVKQ